MQQNATREKDPLLSLALASGTGIADTSKPRRRSPGVGDFAERSAELRQRRPQASHLHFAFGVRECFGFLPSAPAGQ